MIALEALGSLLWKNWKLVAGGVALATLAIMLVFAKADARHWRKAYDSDHAALTLEVSKNKINLASIDTLTKALADKNAESLARAKAYDDAKASDARTIAAMDKKYASTKAARDALLAISKVPGGNDACKVPPALSGALEGL